MGSQNLKRKIAVVGFTSVATTTALVVELIPNCDVIQATCLSIAIWLLGAGFGLAVGYVVKDR